MVAFSPGLPIASIPADSMPGIRQRDTRGPSLADTCTTLLPDGPDAAHSSTRRSRRAFVITEAELKLMAAAAIIGLSSQPVSG